MVVVDLGKLSKQYNFLPQKLGDCELGVLESTFESLRLHEEHLVQHSRAVDKFFSLGVLTFTTHHKQLCAVATCYLLQIQMPQFGGASAPPSTHLSTALHRWKIRMPKMYLYCLGLKGRSTKGGKEHQGVLIH